MHFNDYVMDQSLKILTG